MRETGPGGPHELAAGERDGRGADWYPGGRYRGGAAAYLDQVAPAVINWAGIGPVARERGQVHHAMYQPNPTDIAGTIEFVARPRRAPRDPKVQ